MGIITTLIIFGPLLVEEQFYFDQSSNHFINYSDTKNNKFLVLFAPFLHGNEIAIVEF